MDVTKAPTSGNPNYEKVFDLRKQRVHGLWKRGPRFYGRVQATDQAGRKRDIFRSLAGAETVAAAKTALRKLQEELAATSVPVMGACPAFAAYAERYLSEVSVNKRVATQRKERTQLDWWIARIGALTLRQVHRTHVNVAISDLIKGGLSPRTANLYVGTLRGVLKRGLEEGLIRELPTVGLRPLKVSTRKRELLPMTTFRRVLAAAPGATKNAAQFIDYFEFLLFSGAREKESLRIAWSDVDFENHQVSIGSDGMAKNHEPRTVDFNPDLERLLVTMKARRAPDSKWLFPSPQRGEKDDHARTFRESLRLACDAAKAPRFGFHDARHFFISQCVMAGVDFMTIARWVGHKDGGVLIGKVYGHVANEHRQKMAAKVTFGGGII